MIKLIVAFVAFVAIAAPTFAIPVREETVAIEGLELNMNGDSVRKARSTSGFDDNYGSNDDVRSFDFNTNNDRYSQSSYGEGSDDRRRNRRPNSSTNKPNYNNFDDEFNSGNRYRGQGGYNNPDNDYSGGSSRNQGFNGPMPQDLTFDGKITIRSGGYKLGTFTINSSLSPNNDY